MNEKRRLIIPACDQPFVSSAIIRKLMATENAIAARSYADIVGIPALFKSRYFDALISHPEKSGAKRLIDLNRRDVAFSEPAIDIDAPADFARLQP